MKTPLQFLKSREGFVLIVMMASLVVILTVFAGVMVWISTNGSQTQHNQAFMSSEAAAEGATELIYAQMDQDYLYHSLSSSSSTYSSLTPNTTGWPVQYTFSNTVTIASQSSTLTTLGSQYANLLAFPETNIITSTAIPSGQRFNVPATVSQKIIFASVPVFQFAIFYNIDLDMSPGQPMGVNGTTFCNHNIWCYPGGQMTFNGPVEAAGLYSFAWDTNGDQASNITGSPATPSFNAGTPLSHVSPLILPIGANSSTNNNPTNVEAIINIPPAGIAAPQTNAYLTQNQVYDFNAASLIISNWATGTSRSQPAGNNFTVYLQDSLANPAYVVSNGVPMHWIQLTNDYYIYSNNFSKAIISSPTNYVPNFNFNNFAGINWTNPGVRGTNYVFYASFSFLTNITFTDRRESAAVQGVQVDINLLRTWITNSGPNGGNAWNQELGQDLPQGINSIYVYNDVPVNGQSQLPAVCVINGQRLPNSTNAINGEVTSGLTVVTPQPLYVIGDYNVQIDGSAVVTGSHNTSDTYPAAFLADAITILSTNWPNFKNQSNYGNRPAANTTVNAACLEGIVQSTGGGNGNNAHYSGGVENFLRLMEDWAHGGGAVLTYNGSIMVMFPSQYATNYWQQPGNYYGIPTRNWGFDTNFEIQSKLPPLTPQFRTVVRNQWSGY